MSENYIQIQVPGVPYSVVRVELTDDLGGDVAKAIGAALELQAAHADAFNGVRDPNADMPEPAYDYHPNAPRAPQTNSASANTDWQGVTFYCQQHNADLKPSIRNKTMDWDDALQMQVPASWFHSLPDGKSHSVYRSQAGIRQAVGSR